MNVEYIAPIILSYCISFLRERPVGTRYRPQINEFYLDSKMVARIIRHDGNLRAETDQAELKFFSNILKQLQIMNIVDSPVKKETFEITRNDDFRCVAINVTTKKDFSLKPFKGLQMIKEDKEYVSA